MKQIDGQMSLFDFIAETKPEPELLPCDTCGHDIKGCCDYDYIKNHDYCVLGSKWIPKEKPICDHSEHTCNKQNLQEIADTLDDLQCPHVCCRLCSTKNCGARCNGSEEPKEIIYPVDIRGLCDDAYCPKCGEGLDEYRVLDCERCPYCGTRISWAPWYRQNEKCMTELWGENWAERIRRRVKDGNINRENN